MQNNMVKIVTLGYMYTETSLHTVMHTSKDKLEYKRSHSIIDLDYYTKLLANIQ